MNPAPLIALLLAAPPPAARPPAAVPAVPAGAAAAEADGPRVDPSWKALSPGLWFDPAERRLVLSARVVLREGPLEHLLCTKGTKDHESILATRVAPLQIHAGLIRVGAEAGHPVRFEPKFEPPAGTAIAIDLQWEQDGRTRHADARDWVTDERAKHPLTTDWVFAGSRFVNDPATNKPYYTAEDGDLMTVANFGNAILDLPFASTADDTGRTFVANADRIPPRGTAVLMSLRPRTPVKTPPAAPDPPRP